MNRSRFTLVLLFITIASHSQIDFGIKGGLNLNFSKEATISGDFNFTNNSDNTIGYHIGLMAEFEIQSLGIDLRPELLYTNLKYDYTDLIDLGSNTLTVQKIDIPVLLGINITGPLRLLVGPSFEFTIDSDFDINEFREFGSDDFSLNGQLGLGLKFDKFDLDIRWERGLSKTESTFVTDIANVGVNFDKQPNQLILGATYRFGL